MSRAWEEYHRIARDEGLAPALDALCEDMLPGLLPCGPHGHAVVTPRTLLKAGRAWCAGRPAELPPGGPEVLGSAELPGGEVVMVRQEIAATAEYGPPDRRAGWSLGLVWLRLGLSEALREAVVAHLGSRTAGPEGTPLLQQQLVKVAVADALVEHLEVRAVLTGVPEGQLSPAALEDLQRRLTDADRGQVRLLGASGYLADGPGQVAYVSEVLAEAYAMAPKKEETAAAQAGVAGGRCW
ncbi:hypothetical protein [Streptomyces sp. TRM64462]|uniref:hypothetical protein n=1 Tax=Streptomyces sp. TRM64462 TaxID=2741726 RepID=UPI00158630B5|nr:hypothetical protein [Streptomyces sp. TRM64462]